MDHKFLHTHSKISENSFLFSGFIIGIPPMMEIAFLIVGLCIYTLMPQGQEDSKLDSS